MDLIFYFLEHSVCALPFITIYLQLKIFKINPKVTAYLSFLYLLMSIFFWVKIKDVYLTVYQSLAYTMGFILIWAENVLNKKQEDSEIKEDL